MAVGSCVMAQTVRSGSWWPSVVMIALSVTVVLVRASESACTRFFVLCSSPRCAS